MLTRSCLALEICTLFFVANSCEHHVLGMAQAGAVGVQDVRCLKVAGSGRMQCGSEPVAICVDFWLRAGVLGDWTITHLRLVCEQWVSFSAALQSQARLCDGTCGIANISQEADDGIGIICFMGARERHLLP